MKQFKHLFIFILFLMLFIQHNSIFANAQNTERNDLNLRDYQYIYMPKNSVIKAILQSEISTSTHKKGDLVRLINPMNIYMKEINFIPKNSIFIGKIIEMERPKEGIDGYFKINIDSVLLPDNQKIPLDAYIWTKKGNKIIGGDFAPRSEYRKMVHKTQGFGTGIIQLLPSGSRLMGKDKIIKAGEELIIVLNSDLKIRIISD